MLTRPAYPSDPTEVQWALLAPLLPPAKPGGHQRTVHLWDIFNASFSLLRTGCACRMVLRDLPPWGTMHDAFRQWRLHSTWAWSHEVPRLQVCEAAGRDPTLSAAILDRQTVNTTETGGLAAMMARRR
jgi:putative transposase